METNAHTRAQRELQAREREHARLADRRKAKLEAQLVLIARGHSIAEAIYATRGMQP